MAVKFDNLTLMADNRHGWPLERSPQAHVVATYFWGTGEENHLLGGGSARPIIVNGIIGGSQFTNHATFSQYLNQIHKLIGREKGSMTANIGAVQKRWTNLYLALVEELAQPGQKLAVPLPDAIGGTSGPAGGGYWQEVNLHFVQVKI